ncbi:MAG: RHS repeat protein [Polyangiaceae bacterium]|nr:RHS repeat protein [Polyangiaceae bacterium]
MLPSALIITVASLLALGCRAARLPAEEGALRDSPSPSSSASTTREQPLSSVIDGSDACPFTSELGPAVGRVFRGCNVFAPMDYQLPFVACTRASPCLRPCRVKDVRGGSVAYVHTYRYDAEGRLSEDESRDANGVLASTRRYAYSSATEWIIEEVDLAPNRKVLRFDSNGRLVEKVTTFQHGPVYTFQFEYDGAGKVLVEHAAATRPDRKPLSQDFPYEYDDKGRLVARHQPHIGRPEYKYSYGADGKVETIAYHGMQFHPRRDAAGRVVEMLDGARPYQRFVYDDEGRLTKVQEFAGDQASDVRLYDYDCVLNAQ